MNGYTILSIVLYFLFYIAVILLLSLWIFFIICRRRRHPTPYSFSTPPTNSSTAAATEPATSLHGDGTSGGAARGLEKAVIDALPAFKFSAGEKTSRKGGGEGSRGGGGGGGGDSSKNYRSEEDDEDDDDQCAVCLAAFEEGETLRSVPDCGHVFHAQCVDAWLCDHPTCPNCRAKVVLPQPLVVESPAVRITIWDAGAVSRGFVVHGSTVGVISRQI